MQIATWNNLLSAARTVYGEWPRLPNSGEDFGFFFPREWVEEWFMMLNRYQILPGAGGWMDQDARVRHDLLVIIGKYGEALDEVRPRDYGT